jgi:hypothetical protein
MLVSLYGKGGQRICLGNEKKQTLKIKVYKEMTWIN